MIVNHEFVKEYNIEMLKMNKDNYHPEDTSISQVSMAIKRLVKLGYVKIGSVNLDYGGGKYDKGTEYLKSFLVKNVIYDSYARSVEYNYNVLKKLNKKKADTVTLANILCVIPDKEEREFVIQHAFYYLKRHGVMLVTVYEGDKSGDGAIIIKKDRMHWQELRLTKTYIDEIKNALKHYNIDIVCKNKLIIVKKL